MAAADQVTDRCVEGQNNWKVHSGYRLRCTVFAHKYLAWSGEFRPEADTVKAAVARECASLISKGIPSDFPIPGDGTYPVRFDCGEGIELSVVFATTERLAKDSSAVWGGTCWDGSGCISGPSQAEIVEQLAGHDWFAVVTAGKVYREDKV